MIKFFVIPLFLFFVSQRLVAQSEKSEFIQSFLQKDSTLIKLRLHNRVVYFEANKICQNITLIFENKKNEIFFDILSEVDSNSTSKYISKMLDSFIVAENPMSKSIFEYDSLCKKEFLNIRTQIDQNNKLKRHRAKNIPKHIKVIPFITRKTKSYFSVSTPILFDSMSKALITIHVHYNKVYGYRYIELFEKNCFHEWVSKGKITTLIY